MALAFRIRAQSDDELMARAQADDAEAFAQLYDRHARVALGVARRICRTAERAEDATQEGFLTVWRNRSRFDPARGTVRAWVLMSIRNRAIDSVRRANVHDRRREYDEWSLEHSAESSSVAADVEQREQATEIQAALAELPANQRRVIGLAYFGGLSHTEIAEKLELPAGTVKGRMRLGLAKLRTSMDADETREAAAARRRFRPVIQRAAKRVN